MGPSFISTPETRFTRFFFLFPFSLLLLKFTFLRSEQGFWILLTGWYISMLPLTLNYSIQAKSFGSFVPAPISYLDLVCIFRSEDALT